MGSREEKLIVLNDPYFRKLAILDHLRECLIIDEEIKEQKNKILDKGNPTLKNLEYHFENELTDLYILLKHEVTEENIEERMEKFVKNASKIV